MIWPMRKFHVGRNQLGVLFDGGEFRGFLRPGTSWRLDPLQRLSLEIVDTAAPDRSQLAGFLLEMCPHEVRERFEAVGTQAGQVAVVYLNGQLHEVLGPNRRALYRKDLGELTATLIDVDASFFAERPAENRREARANDDLRLAAKSAA